MNTKIRFMCTEYGDNLYVASPEFMHFSIAFKSQKTASLSPLKDHCQGDFSVFF